MIVRADVETKAQVRAALDRAAARGTDPVAALDDLQLLHHPGLRREIIRESVLMIAGLLREASVKQLLEQGERMPTTALDTKRVIETWLDRIASQR